MKAYNAAENTREGNISKSVRMYVIIGSIVILLSLTAGACMFFHSNKIPDNLDYSTTKLSEGGAYNVGYVSSINPVPVNQIHRWTLNITQNDGNPVDGAEIKIKGRMPGHMHGMPTKPRVTQYLGDGNYLVEGMKFQMGGWWVMEFEISSGNNSDKVSFNLVLQE